MLMVHWVVVTLSLGKCVLSVYIASICLNSLSLSYRHSFTPVEWPSISAANGIPKIAYVAAGSGVAGSHSVCIDEEGQLYSWGYAKATGLGGQIALNTAVNTPMLVTLPLPAANRIEEMAVTLDEENSSNTTNTNTSQQDKRKKLLRVRSVSCGDCFTVCVTTTGLVYSWGQWSHGRLGLGPIPQAEVRKRGFLGRGLDRNKSNSGSASTASANTTTKLAKYQLRPARILSIDSAIQVACGEAHTLCLLKGGQVLVWGQNSLGQLGLGPTRSGVIKDAFKPILLAHFGRNPFPSTERIQESIKEGKGWEDIEKEREKWSVFQPKEPNTEYEQIVKHKQQETITTVSAINVYCGAFHSLVIDNYGHAWSWGARGSPCLGHGDSMLLGEWANKVNTIFSISTTETAIMVPYELMQWCCKWSMPRMIQCLVFDDENKSLFSHTKHDHTSSKRIIHIVGGDLSTAFLTSDYKVYMCGSGPVVPSFEPPLQFDDDEVEQGKDDNTSTTATNTTTTTNSTTNTSTSHLVTTPRCPSSSWFKELCTRSVRYLSGSGCRLFIIVDEEFASVNLTNRLYKKLTASKSTGTTTGRSGGSSVRSGGGSVSSGLDDDYSDNSDNDHDDDSNRNKRKDDDQRSINSAISNTSSRFHSLFESRGRADCMVIASGHIFLCHRALLAVRSQELKNMIIMESPSSTGGRGDDDYDYSTGVIQILLPELHNDAARALFFYLYRDTLPTWAVTNVPLLNALQRCGRTLLMPRLTLICERFLDILSKRDYAASLASTTTTSTTTTGVMELPVIEMPPSTLAKDLGSMVGDPEFADVRFIAEGKAIAAHRFILETRCEYFRNMFRSGMAEDGLVGSMRTVDVVVPGK